MYLFLPSFPTQSVLSSPTSLFYQSSLLVFLTCKSLLRSTVWSQYMITLIILIIEAGPYFQCTCIVITKNSATEIIFCSIPQPQCLWLHESHAFMSWALRPFQSFSFLIDPLPQFSSSQGLAFQLSVFPTSSLFLPCFLCRECLASSNNFFYLIPIFLFNLCNLHVTKYKNNESEGE